MELKLIIAGIGGQGVIYATKLLAQAALARGERVMASENHGMSQRGGSVLTHFKIGGSEAPLIRRGTADALIAFDRVEALRSLPYLRPGGGVYANSADGLDAAVADRLSELGVAVFTIDASARVKELGTPAVMNLVVLGFAAALGGLGLSVDDLKAAARQLGPAQAVDLNLTALDIGAAAAADVKREAVTARP
jgi:indolepyruvate ferredoxin oxidoreductase beta subunit